MESSEKLHRVTVNFTAELVFDILLDEDDFIPWDELEKNIRHVLLEDLILSDPTAIVEVNVDEVFMEVIEE